MQRRAIAFEQTERAPKTVGGDRKVICETKTGVVAVNLPDEFGSEEAKIAVLQVADVDFVDRILDLGQLDEDAVEVTVMQYIPKS